MPTRRRRTASVAAVVVAAAVLLLHPGPAEGDPAPAQVRMVDFAFNPIEITVPLGSTVTWVYDDSQCDLLPVCEGHDTRAEVNGPDGKPLWDSPTFKGKGKTFSTTMTQVGKIPYICTIHQSALANMDGVINVVPAAASPTGSPPPPTPPSATPAAASALAGVPAAPAPAGGGGGAVAPAVATPELPRTGAAMPSSVAGQALLLLATAIGGRTRLTRAKRHRPHR